MHLLDREFKYTDKEREWLEDRFEIGLLELMRQQVLPADDNGNPTGGGIYKAQIAFLYAGLRHYGNVMTESKVKELVRQVTAEPLMVMRVLNKAVKACMASGCLGFVYSPPAPPEEEEAEDPKEKAGAAAVPEAGDNDKTH